MSNSTQLIFLDIIGEKEKELLGYLSGKRAIVHTTESKRKLTNVAHKETLVKLRSGKNYKKTKESKS